MQIKIQVQDLCGMRLVPAEINVKQYHNRQDDTKFQALSKSLIACIYLSTWTKTVPHSILNKSLL